MSRQDLSGTCPGLPYSMLDNMQAPRRRCLHLPPPNSNRKTPHQKPKSVSSSMLVQEGLLLKFILKPQRTKK